MTDPITSKKMRVKIIVNGNEYILGVVQLVDVEAYRQGGVEKKYGKQASGQPANRHRIGMKRVRFVIRRMFKADETSKHDLLYDLHNNDTYFDLEEYVNEE